MGLNRATAPVAEPVSVAEQKAHMRVEHSDDDTLIGGLISAAREHLEDELVCAIALANWTLTLDEFPTSEVRLDMAPVTAIAAVEYDDLAEGIQQTLPADEYYLDNSQRRSPAWLLPVLAWPGTYETANAVRITFTAGYSTVPPPLVIAIKMLASEWYDNRSAAGDRRREALPFAVDRLIQPYRIYLG